MARAKADDPKQPHGTRWTAFTLEFMKRQAKATGKKSWREWLFDDINKRALAEYKRRNKTVQQPARVNRNTKTKDPEVTTRFKNQKGKK